MASKPIKVRGNWDEGYVLDNHIEHSEFVGYDDYGHPQFHTVRTELGELLYQFKYRDDASGLRKIVKRACDCVTSWEIEPDCIIPVPPSNTARQVQPVYEIANGMSKRLKIPVCTECVTKVKKTPELKNVTDYKERLKLLKDAFDVSSSSVKGKEILIVDDLFRSGATLNALADVLYKTGKVKRVFVLALTKTRGAA